jgi:hypothetical protein
VTMPAKMSTQARSISTDSSAASGDREGGMGYVAALKSSPYCVAHTNPHPSQRHSESRGEVVQCDLVHAVKLAAVCTLRDDPARRRRSLRDIVQWLTCLRNFGIAPTIPEAPRPDLSGSPQFSQCGRACASGR